MLTICIRDVENIQKLITSYSITKLFERERGILSTYASDPFIFRFSFPTKSCII